MDQVLGFPRDRFQSARDQLHWATQALAAACDAGIHRRPDDSQSSLAFHDDSVAWRTDPFPSGRRLAIDFAAARIDAIDAHGAATSALALPGKTLRDAMDWAAASVPDLDGETIEPRDYDMPTHPFGDGAAFDGADAEVRAVISAYLAASAGILEQAIADHGPATDLLLWPHHFDIGAILLLKEGADPSKDPCVGIGSTAGDGSIDEPYKYANPYGVDRPADLPAPRAGSWTDSWFGAVLRVSECEGATIGDSTRAMIADVTAFVRANA